MPANQPKLRIEHIPEVPAYTSKQAHRNVFFWPITLSIAAILIIFLTSSIIYYTLHRGPAPKPVAATAHVAIDPTLDRLAITVTKGENIGDTVTQQIQKDPSLAGRTVALVIIYTGAKTDADINTAVQTDETVKNTLKSLNIHGFSQAIYYDNPDASDPSHGTDLYILDSPPTSIWLDLYLFK